MSQQRSSEKLKLHAAAKKRNRKLRPKAWCLVFLVAAASTAATSCLASPCKDLPVLNDWTRAQSASTSFWDSSVLARMKLEQEKWNAGIDAAEKIYHSYRNGTWTADQGSKLELCLQTSAASPLVYALQKVMFEETAHHLAQSRSPSIQAFARKLTSSNLPMYQVFSHYRITDPTGRKAGFHRGHRSLFMDFAKIPPTEWDVIFIHEFSHSLDPYLARGVEVYGDPTLAKKVAQVAQAAQDSGSVSSADRALVRKWLMAGLDRGLLAEWRAWVPTVQLYLDGRKEGFFPHIDWLDAILARKKDGESLESFLFHFLDTTFPDPDADGIYALPLIRKELQQIRAELRSGKLPPL